MKTKEYEFHPYASVVPMLGQTELNALAADIQGSGLRRPIVLLDGQILDGRNRYKACRMVGVEPEFLDFNGSGDPIAFIVSENLCRRHLTASQKALAVAKIAALPRGNPKLKIVKNPNDFQIGTNAELEKTIEQAAREVDVSPRTIGQAKQVLRDASSETIQQVERGEKSVATVVREIRKEKETKAAHFDKTGYPIPDVVLSDWARAANRDLLNHITTVRSAVKDALESKDVIFAEINNTTVADLNNAYSALKNVIPYAVCTSCQGKLKTKCALCRGRGFISEFAYNHFVPAETRTMREKMRSAK